MFESERLNVPEPSSTKPRTIIEPIKLAKRDQFEPRTIHRRRRKSSILDLPIRVPYANTPTTSFYFSGKKSMITDSPVWRRIREGKTTLIRRAQPDVGTRALRAAMTSAEFQRRDASRARGPKVSTGVLAQLRSARRRESRERNAAEGFAGRGAKGGEGEGRQTTTTEARRATEEG